MRFRPPPPVDAVSSVIKATLGQPNRSPDELGFHHRNWQPKKCNRSLQVTERQCYSARVRNCPRPARGDRDASHMAEGPGVKIVIEFAFAVPKPISLLVRLARSYGVKNDKNGSGLDGKCDAIGARHRTSL